MEATAHNGGQRSGKYIFSGFMDMQDARCAHPCEVWLVNILSTEQAWNVRHRPGSQDKNKTELDLTNLTMTPKHPPGKKVLLMTE